MVCGLSLFTDLYQLSMAQAHFTLGRHQRRVVFHAFFRRSPYGGGYAVSAELGTWLEQLAQLAFSDEELAFLRTVRALDGGALFDPRFLDYLATLKLELDVDAMPEGRVAFALEPLVRVEGELLGAQLVETALLNAVGFQTLIATKAARIAQAAGSFSVIELGARRAQGFDAGVFASRAATIGGADATSNVLAAARYGLPLVGTMAHAWVMSFDSEQEAFDAYVSALPGHAALVVDTYDTARGLDRAIGAARSLAPRGQRLSSVRIDSGELDAQSRLARARLDAAGLFDTRIVVSDDLDEYAVERLVRSGAPIDVYGVGTRLVTGGEHSSLGLVYKLGAIRSGAGWRAVQKRAGDSGKSSLPGRLGVERSLAGGELGGDRVAPASTLERDLLVPVLRAGHLVHQESLESARQRARDDLARLPEAVRRLRDPETYPVRLDVPDPSTDHPAAR